MNWIENSIVCVKKYGQTFLKEYIYTISVDLSQSLWEKIPYWLKIRKQYGLSLKMIAYAWVEAVKARNVKNRY